MEGADVNETIPGFAVAVMVVGMLGSFAVGVLHGWNWWRRKLWSARDDLKRERIRSAMLEKMLEARIASEEEAECKAWCAGWFVRGELEELVRGQRVEVAERWWKGMVN